MKIGGERKLDKLELVKKEIVEIGNCRERKLWKIEIVENGYWGNWKLW